VDNLKEKLAIQEIELKIKNDAADKLIQIVGIETDKVSKEKSFGMTLTEIIYTSFLNIYK
jgi:dynein heavy chain